MKHENDDLALLFLGFHSVFENIGFFFVFVFYYGFWELRIKSQQSVCHEPSFRSRSTFQRPGTIVHGETCNLLHSIIPALLISNKNDVPGDSKVLN